MIARLCPLVAACAAVMISCVWAGEGSSGEPAAIHVDANAGDDANDGHTPATAFRTLNKAQAALEAARAKGENPALKLARGSVWREFRDAPEGGMSFGLPGLRVEAYGKGDLPTLSGFMILPNEAFRQPDAARFPNLWSQTITPPRSYAASPHGGMRPGLLVGGDRPLRLIHPPDSRFAKLRDFHQGIDGLGTEDAVLAFIAKNPNTYYPKENPDGTVEVFVNSGSDPTKEGLTYEFRVYPAGWNIHGAEIDGLRLTGMGGRHGLDGYPVELKNMELAYGNTHTVFVTEGILENVKAAPYTVRNAPEVSGQHPRRGLQRLAPTALGETYSLFHSYNPDSRGVIYKNCSGADAQLGFFCHNKKARRPFIAILDSVTENVGVLIRHRPYTETMYLIGHRHGSSKGGPYGMFGDGAQKNFVEDSILKFSQGGWNPDAGHLRMRNSLVLTKSAPALAIDSKSMPPEGVDWEITNSTLILDLRGSKGKESALIDIPAGEGKTAGAKRRLVLRDCVIAVLTDGNELPLLSAASEGLDLTIENCVFSGVKNLREDQNSTLPATEIFANLNPESDFPLGEKFASTHPNTGFQPGRPAEIRPVAESLEGPLREKLLERRERKSDGKSGRN